MYLLYYYNLYDHNMISGYWFQTYICLINFFHLGIPYQKARNPHYVQSP